MPSAIYADAWGRDPRHETAYNYAALLGGACRAGSMSSLGKRVRRGSPEAKARMAYLRSLRGRRGGNKSSYMSYVRSFRRARGGFLPFKLAKLPFKLAKIPVKIGKAIMNIVKKK